MEVLVKKENLKRALLAEGYEVDETGIVKNNGCTWDAFVVKKAGSNIGATVYLDGIDYCSVDQVLANVKNSLKDSNTISSSISSSVTEWCRAKNALRPVLVNLSRNMGYLSDKPYKVFMDLAIICVIDVSLGDAEGTVAVNNEFLKIWDVAYDEVLQCALDNTQENYQLLSMWSVLKTLSGSGEMDELSQQGEADSEMCICSNQSRHKGAACILNHDILNAYLKQRGVDKCYILPSSVHEVILVDAQGVEPIELKMMIREVNATAVSPEEFLSDNLYQFDGTKVTIV